MAVIQIESQDILLEVTDCCRTGCVIEYCYKKGIVSSSGQHVPLKIIRERLEWIKTFTNAKMVTILGGEALLHPDFIEICNLVQSMGLRLDLITSGVVGKGEQKNLKYVFELFEKGKIDINLSLHSGRNEKQFEYFVSELHKRVEKRHQNIKLAGKEPQKQFDLFVKWVVSRQSNLNKVEFHKIASWIYGIVRIKKLPIDNPDFATSFENYRKQFENGTKALYFIYWHLDEYTGLRTKINIIGQQEINYTTNGPIITLAEVGVCPGIGSKIEANFVVVDSMIIRADGGTSFAESQCIDMLHPLLTVNPSQTSEDVYQAIAGSLRQIQSHVFIYNRVKASENCDEGGAEKECKACPFSRMCTPCWQTKRPWEKG